MLRTTLFTLLASTVLRVCGEKDASAPTASANTTLVPAAMPGLAPSHGGSVAVSGGLRTEILPLPDGRLIAYITDAERAPIVSDEVDFSLRKADGSLVAVPVTYDQQVQGYVGRPSGVTAGRYGCSVVVKTVPNAQPIQVQTEAVIIPVAAVIPSARHGGLVQIVGDRVVEMVSTSSGDVAMFWSDLAGNPLPAAEVSAPNATMTVNGHAHTVVMRTETDRMTAHLFLNGGSVSGISLPSVIFEGVTFHGVVSVRPPPVVASLPAPQIVHRPPAGYFVPPPASILASNPSPAIISAALPPVQPTVLVTTVLSPIPSVAVTAQISQNPAQNRPTSVIAPATAPAPIVPSVQPPPLSATIGTPVVSAPTPNPPNAFIGSATPYVEPVPAAVVVQPAPVAIAPAAAVVAPQPLAQAPSPAYVVATPAQAQPVRVAPQGSGPYAQPVRAPPWQVWGPAQRPGVVVSPPQPPGVFIQPPQPAVVVQPAGRRP